MTNVPNIHPGARAGDGSLLPTRYVDDSELAGLAGGGGDLWAAAPWTNNGFGIYIEAPIDYDDVHVPDLTGMTWEATPADGQEDVVTFDAETMVFNRSGLYAVKMILAVQAHDGSPFQVSPSTRVSAGLNAEFGGAQGTLLRTATENGHVVRGETRDVDYRTLPVAEGTVGRLQISLSGVVQDPASYWLQVDVFPLLLQAPEGA